MRRERCFHPTNRKKKSCFLSLSTLIKFPPVLSGVITQPVLSASASGDAENVTIFLHLSENKPLLGSGSLWLGCAGDGQEQPRATTHFGDATEISRPNYRPLPNSSSPLGKPSPVEQNRPVISLTTNGSGKLSHLWRGRTFTHPAPIPSPLKPVGRFPPSSAGFLIWSKPFPRRGVLALTRPLLSFRKQKIPSPKGENTQLAVRLSL